MFKFLLLVTMALVCSLQFSFAVENLDKNTLKKIKKIRSHLIPLAKLSQTNGEQSYFRMIQKTKIQSVLLKKKTTIFDFIKQRYRKLPQDTAVNVYSHIHQGKYLFLKLKNNKFRFAILSTDATPLKNVLDIDVHPENFKTYSTEIRKSKNYFNQELKYKLYFLTNFEQADNQFAIDALGDSGATTGKAQRLAANILNDWDFPLKFGFSFQFFSQILTNSNNDTIKNQSFYLGPILSYTLFNSKEYLISIDAGIFKSISQSITTTENQYQLSSTLISFGSKLEWKTSVGNLVIGANWNKYQVQYSGKVKQSALGRFNSSSYDIVIGYSKGMSL